MTKLIEHTIEGNPEGHTLVFIHGWPDNAGLWRKQVTALGSDFRCVLLTLPNFGELAIKAGGFDFPEMVKQLAATVREVQPEGKVSLVTHDWGAYLATCWSSRTLTWSSGWLPLMSGAMCNRPD